MMSAPSVTISMARDSAQSVSIFPSEENESSLIFKIPMMSGLRCKLTARPRAFRKP